MISTTLPRSEIAGFAAIHAGAGRPILLLHGVGLQADVWAPQIETLQQDYQVIAPDMPGHGASPCPAMQLDISGYAETYLPLLESLDEPAMVVGHSMGAMIALELTRLAPNPVRAVAALNAVFERSPDALKAVKERADTLDGVSIPDPTSTLERWFGSSASSERSACEAWLRASDPLGYKMAYSAFASVHGPTREALKAISCPALFASGALEPNSTPAMSQAMAGLAPKGKSLIIAGAAHMMPLTHADEVNAALLELAQEAWA